MIGSSKRIAIAVVGGLAVSVFGVVAAQGLERTTGIWKVLRDGHFSGPMNEGAHVRPIKGFIAAKDKKYRFWEYSWVNKDSGHGGTGLLVFEQAGSGLTYLGAYDILLDDFKGPVHPVIRGKTVFFLSMMLKSWATKTHGRCRSRMARRRLFLAVSLSSSADDIDGVEMKSCDRFKTACNSREACGGRLI